EAGSALCQWVEYRLKVGRRAADHPQNLGGSGLPATRSGKFTLELTHLLANFQHFTSARRLGRHDDDQSFEHLTELLDDEHGNGRRCRILRRAARARNAAPGHTFWYLAENLGRATTSTGMRKYKRHASRVDTMPAFDAELTSADSVHCGAAKRCGVR